MGVGVFADAVEPHGHSPWPLHSRPNGGDIPSPQMFLLHRVAHGRRPWPNDGVDATPLFHRRLNRHPYPLRLYPAALIAEEVREGELTFRDRPQTDSPSKCAHN